MSIKTLTGRLSDSSIKYSDTQSSGLINDLRNNIDVHIEEGEGRVEAYETLDELETRLKGLIYNINVRSVLPFDF